MSRNTYMGVRDSYPGCEVLRGKFLFEDDDDSWAVSDANGHESHAQVTAADAGTGLVTLGFPAGRKGVQIWAYIEAPDSTQSSQRDVTVTDINKTDGTAVLVIEDKADAQADPIDASLLHVKVELTGD